jgi:hypothetical protein
MKIILYDKSTGMELDIPFLSPFPDKGDMVECYYNSIKLTLKVQYRSFLYDNKNQLEQIIIWVK